MNIHNLVYRIGYGLQEARSTIKPNSLSLCDKYTLPEEESKADLFIPLYR